MSKGGIVGRKHTKAILAIRKPTMRELGWAAGFLEGEGSFSRSGAACNGGERVRACQVNPDPLLLLQQIFGGPVKPRQQKHINHSPYWEWYIGGARARGVMLTLYPLMSSKRKEQIKKALINATS